MPVTPCYQHPPGSSSYPPTSRRSLIYAEALSRSSLRRGRQRRKDRRGGDRRQKRRQCQPRHSAGTSTRHVFPPQVCCKPTVAWDGPCCSREPEPCPAPPTVCGGRVS